jgi:hypothetical protein
MPNLLNVPTGWLPDYWDTESAYEVDTGEDVANMIWQNTRNIGDTLQGDIYNYSADDTDFTIFENGIGVAIYTVPGHDHLLLNWVVASTVGALSLRFEHAEGVSIRITPDESPDPPDPPTPSYSYDGEYNGDFLVYELDRGWSFDGNYIPHFVELNWYFGEDPFTYKSIQKVRIHGLSKGYTMLEVSVAGMQTEYDSDYMEPQFIDLPLNPVHVSSEFLPVTNYVDLSNRGISLQLKFEGRNTDITKPEPAHVIQVLAIQSSPQDVGKRAN